MSRRHGINSNGPTYDRLVIDAGEVRIGFNTVADPGDILAATRGGSTFTVETEYREMPVDGAKGPVKGGRRITKVTAKMVLNIVEWSGDLINKALPGSTVANHPSNKPTHDKITRALQILAADYIDSVAILGEVSGSAQPVVCVLRNALNTGNFEVGLVDNEESVAKLELTAHFDPDALDTEPWEIYYPQDVNPTTESQGG